MRGIKSKGQILMIVMLAISMLLISGIIYLKIVISERYMTDLFIQKEKAFYMAEAGLEDGKSIIANNPNWFTDNPHSPADDTLWLMNSAKGSIKTFGGGSYKIIRESGKDIIYSIGYSRNGRSVVRARFEKSPFKTYEFKTL